MFFNRYRAADACWITTELPGTPDSPSNPQRVHLLSGKGVVMMAAGLEHSLALTDSGDLYAFGDNLRYTNKVISVVSPGRIPV